METQIIWSENEKNAPAGKNSDQELKQIEDELDRTRQGAAMGPMFVAVEPRFKAAMLILGGFYLQHSAPEVDAFNFAPRRQGTGPALERSIRLFYPTETSQLPMFQLFAVPQSQKRRVIYDTGHNIPRPDLVRETLDWLDRYLGPVR